MNEPNRFLGTVSLLVSIFAFCFAGFFLQGGRVPYTLIFPVAGLGVFFVGLAIKNS